MAYSEYCREKLAHCKFERSSKPFIDKDLQLQLPGYDFSVPNTDAAPSNPIYTHFSGSEITESMITYPINETELYHVMAEAENSYEAWKKMQQRLKEAVKNKTH